MTELPVTDREEVRPTHGSMTAGREELTEGLSVPIDTAWFKGAIADRRTSARQLAFAMGIDPAAMSLMLRGKRKMSVMEAGELAQLLGQPLDEVIRRAGGVHGGIRTPSQIAAMGGVGGPNGAAGSELSGVGVVRHLQSLSRPGRSVKVAGWVDGAGVVHMDPPAGPPVVERPPGLPPDAQALRVQDGEWDGWLVFYRPGRGVPAEAVGQMCIAEIEGGPTVLRFVNRSYTPGRWAIGGGMHERQDGVALVAAAPVLWMKQR